ncbi:TetR family transcriptional regulator [Actinoplanes ianthinogenes]|uniref:TetR family transcriptional regulator n=1 Tax=Actinoplanes ianthinogenes TaxID=122358 RepID=A0ABM7M3E3_9ACTN|nr:TetR/AcrR family transcriptional regulator [Actinoplanes ianthinogenes]BCJ46090.1 TetR family transcriptional regulator [Actinoplanes ianthinogenes]GGR26145.1 TetR family transcriptional regulator [Actinoplanes ianthinogenes]
MPDIKHFDPDATLDTVVRLFWKQGVASTGIQDIVNATGLNRSSLYATFGGKQQLYMAALERYVSDRSHPVLGRLAQDGRGLPAVVDFFANLIDMRCSGEFAQWGCMISNAHAGTENGDADVRAVLDRQHRRLHDALRAALTTAQSQGQLAENADPETGAQVLALLAHGVNLRSRAGADAAELRRTVAAAIEAVTGQARRSA